MIITNHSMRYMHEIRPTFLWMRILRMDMDTHIVDSCISMCCSLKEFCQICGFYDNSESISGFIHNNFSIK